MVFVVLLVAKLVAREGDDGEGVPKGFN